MAAGDGVVAGGVVTGGVVAGGVVAGGAVAAGDGVATAGDGVASAGSGLDTAGDVLAPGVGTASVPSTGLPISVGRAVGGWSATIGDEAYEKRPAVRSATLIAMSSADSVRWARPDKGFMGGRC